MIKVRPVLRLFPLLNGEVLVKYGTCSLHDGTWVPLEGGVCYRGRSIGFATGSTRKEWNLSTRFTGQSSRTGYEVSVFMFRTDSSDQVG